MRRKAASRAERSEERERSSASSWSKTKESRAEREGGFEEEGVAGEGREVWEEEKQKGRRRRRRDSLEVAQWRRSSDSE